MSITTKFAAAVLALATLAPVSAPAAPLIIGSLYQEQVLKVCDGTASCEVLFTAVPSAKTLVIREVACVFTMTSTASVAATSVAGKTAANANVQRTVYPVATQVSLISGVRRYQIQSPINLIMQATEKPRVFLGATANAPEFNAICTIYGNLG